MTSNDRSKEWYARNKARSYWTQVKRNYGVTKNDVVALYVKQNSVCPICARRVVLKRGQFHIDHCHRTNKVRGVLHSGCNTALGLLHDDITRMRRAIAYVQWHIS